MNDSALSRLARVLTSPVATFRSIAERPSLVAIVLVLIAVSAVLGTVIHQHTDYEEITRIGLENRGQEIDADQFETAVGLQEKFGGVFAPLSGAIGFLIMLLIALIYWVIFKFLGSEMTYKQGLSTYLHSAMPMILYSVIAAIVIMGKGDLSYAEITTRNFLASNLAFLAPQDSGLALKGLLTGIDFFTLWMAVLAFLGFRTVAKVSSATAGIVVGGMWLLGLAFRFASAALQGGGFS